MIVTATDLKNNFGKMLKLLDYEDIIVKKNGRVLAKIVKYTEPLDTYGTIKETYHTYRPEDRKVTYEEFLKFTANSEERYELIDGEIYMLASPKVTHQSIVGLLYGEFYKYFEGKSCTPFVSPYDIKLEVDNKMNVVQPDLGVICNLEEFTDEEDRYMGIPTLVVEVLSKSSVTRDMVRKLNIYMLSGIEEYWIIDSFNETAKVYSFEDYEISDYKEFKKGTKIESFTFDGLSVKW
ncbi:MAG: type II toxin-antitoxin system Phd/YefM family antitoxin [Vallitalea sp.]|jgi:Uma2 family endonuclease|nr:type II toxin-antitoxin system Phd/YefM family antitoxin [Vallitalea sp.]MCT4597710.1 type II toxin-antitoxin system Phd/YefM family antitoxin [Vallitalea sp.]